VRLVRLSRPNFRQNVAERLGNAPDLDADLLPVEGHRFHDVGPVGLRSAVAGARQAAQHAGKVLVPVQLGPGGHDVEHAPDAAPLVGLRQVEADALQTHVRLDQTAKIVQVHLERPPGQACRGAGADRVDVGPLERQSHDFSLRRRHPTRGRTFSPSSRRPRMTAS
jgi:hypothetical protein